MEGRIEQSEDYFLWIIKRCRDKIDKAGSKFSPNFNFDGRVWSLEIINYRSSINLALKNFSDCRTSDSVTLGLKVDDNYIRRDAVPDASGRIFTASRVVSRNELHDEQIRPGDVLTVFCKISTEELDQEKKWQHRLKSIAKLQRDLGELFSNDHNSDVTLRLKERQFKAHRNILAARSPFFAQRFAGANSNSVLELDDQDPDTFLQFLRYLYTGTVEGMTCQNVKRLYATAGIYRVWELQDECVEFMAKNMPDENVGDFRRLESAAKRLRSSAVSSKCPDKKRKLSL